MFSRGMWPGSGKWLMDFGFEKFDREETSDPVEFPTREAAIAAARKTPERCGDDVVVTSARVYPHEPARRPGHITRLIFRKRPAR